MTKRTGVFVRLSDEQIATIDRIVEAAPVPTTRAAVAGMLLTRGLMIASREFPDVVGKEPAKRGSPYPPPRHMRPVEALKVDKKGKGKP